MPILSPGGSSFGMLSCKMLTDFPYPFFPYCLGFNQCFNILSLLMYLLFDSVVGQQKAGSFTQSERSHSRNAGSFMFRPFILWNTGSSCSCTLFSFKAVGVVMYVCNSMYQFLPLALVNLNFG